MIIISNVPTTSHIRHDEYFPLTVILDDEADLYRHVQFEHEDDGVDGILELCLDWDTHRLRKMLLVHCLSYQVSEMPAPSPESQVGTLCFELPKITYCDSFDVTLYRNGMELRLGTTLAFNWYRSGQVVFGTDANDRLVDVLVLDMSEEDLGHARAEIAYTEENHRYSSLDDA